MELIEGETLAETLRQGPCRLTRRCASARQIAAALEAAHDRGHHPSRSEARQYQDQAGRQRQGARLRPGQSRDRRVSADPRSTRRPSPPAPPKTALILGTAAYMSPEQARGKPVDKRADIWAFGCVAVRNAHGQASVRGQFARRCPWRSREERAGLERPASRHAEARAVVDPPLSPERHGSPAP